MSESNFQSFFNDLLKLIEKYDETTIKVEKNLDYDTVKIFGEKMDSIFRAKTGLDDVLELAYTTAEHHPYWAILYNCAEISKSLLEKWSGDISKDDLDEIRWHLREVENSCKNLENHSKENDSSKVRDK